MVLRHQQAAGSEFRVPLRRQTKASIGPKLGGFRCAFVYRPGIRRYVGASLQWDQVRELGEISGKRAPNVAAEFQIQGTRPRTESNRVRTSPRYLPGITTCLKRAGRSR